LIEIFDFRSDTVSLPTQEMLEAIKCAKLGDDVFREDPTVNRLEQLAAEKMGKEAALLVSSGTQANLIALMNNSVPGKLVILEAESHIYWYEVGGISRIAGLFPWLIKSEFGAMDSKDIENAIRPKNIHFPEPTIISPDQIEKINEVAHKNDLKLYMDGARIFNAAVALEIDVKKFTKYVDNLMFSLSKGLCCPVGSILVGSNEFIEKARKLRKILGGGMRQAGIVAAPGLVALEGMIDRLKDDHRNAKILAEGISKINGLSIDLKRVQTNIVFFDVNQMGISAELFVSKMKERGILALPMTKNTVRMVTYRGINEEQVEKTIKRIEKIANQLKLKN
jgi:threonine aldolase